MVSTTGEATLSDEIGKTKTLLQENGERENELKSKSAEAVRLKALLRDKVEPKIVELETKITKVSAQKKDAEAEKEQLKQDLHFL